MGLEVKRRSLFGFLCAAASANCLRIAAAAEHDLSEPGKLSLTVDRQPLSEALHLLEEKLGRPVIYLREKPEVDDRVLAKEVSLRIQNGSLWDLIEGLGGQADVRLKGVGGRRLLL